MPKYVVRLDDACPTMNHENWNRMMYMLNQYGIKAIIGVIPDNKDSDFLWNNDPIFWQKVREWQIQGHTIAMHGLHHMLKKCDISGNFQLTHRNYSEFVGVPIERQREMIDKGLRIFETNGIHVNCFFAPAHTYDANTVRALSERNEIEFISDGYALKPYKRHGMIFVPSICDSPFPFPFGVFTFVFHPSNMNEETFKSAQYFFQKHAKKFADAQNVIEDTKNSQGIVGFSIERIIYILRGLRKSIKH